MLLRARLPPLYPSGRSSWRPRCTMATGAQVAGDPLVLRSAEQDGRVACLTLNHPAKRNPLSHAMLRQLDSHLDDLKAEAALGGPRVVVLRSTGPVFSAGHDLKELRALSPEGRAELFRLCAGVMTKLQRLPQPVVAEVAGLATAAGCQLVATADLAVAADTASFATPGVRVGLFCSTPAVAVARRVTPPRRALEMLLTGAPLSAAEALAHGLVSRVAPAAALRAHTDALVAQLLASSAAVLALGKAAFYRQVEMGQGAAYDYTSAVMVENLGRLEDAAEGIDAFLQKRPPTWRHR